MKNNLSRSGKQRFWENHISRHSAAGLSQAGYCKLNKISLKSFQYWKRRSRRNEPPPTLIEVPVPSPLPVLSLPQLCLVVERYRIEIGKGFDPEDLERVVRMLGRI
jgi:hypothetical protein